MIARSQIKRGFLHFWLTSDTVLFRPICPFWCPFLYAWQTVYV
nr:MAG TPA: hypothetical protein [Caudoviricetes sp.]